jgi:MFS family permease
VPWREVPRMTLRRESASPRSDRSRGLFRSLRHSVNLRIYLAGHAVSVVGTWVQRVAQDWLILEITHNGTALGVSLAAQFAPMLLLGPYGGLVVDRLDRRRTLLATQAISGLLAVALAVITLLGVVQLWSVLALALGLGLVTVVDVPARQAFVVSMVEPVDYANAQALSSSVNNAGRLIGPAVAGVLIATVGVGVAFMVNAASFVAVLVSLAVLNVKRLRPSPRIERKKGQVREGIRYLWALPQLRVTIVLVAVVAIFGQNFRVVLPLAATELYHGDAATYGWLTSAIGLGALIGAVVSASVQIPTAWSLVVTSVAFGAANLLAAFSPILVMALIVMVGLGVTNIIFNTLARTVMLVNSEPEMHGRMMAIHGQVFLGSTPLGGPLVGWLCELFGARIGFFIAGGTAVLAAVLLARVAYRSRHSHAVNVEDRHLALDQPPEP